MPNYENYMTTNTKVKFLQGLESNILKYLPESANSPSRENAEEGAFYLTTDSHRLFIGQKAENSTAIYAEEISRGVTIVENVSSLPTGGPGGRAVQDGDFYYIKKDNILCVYEGPEVDENGTVLSAGAWQQINAVKTGITNFDTSVNVVNNAATITPAFEAQNSAENKSAPFNIIGGPNITITYEDTNSFSISSVGNQELLVENTNNSQDTPLILTNSVPEDETRVNFKSGSDSDIEISSYQYEPIVLGKTQNGEDETIADYAAAHPNEKLYIYDVSNSSYILTNVNSIASGTTVYRYKPSIVIDSTKITGGTALPRYNEQDSTVTGFLLGVNLDDDSSRFPIGAGVQAASATPYNSQTILDPVIGYGLDDNSGSITETAKFRNGQANLDIYTTAQVNNKIANAMHSVQQTADALTYKGLISNDDIDDIALGISTKKFSIGDTYKASQTIQNFPQPAVINNNEISYKTGDLIIARTLDGGPEDSTYTSYQRVTHDYMSEHPDETFYTYNAPNYIVFSGTTPVVGTDYYKAVEVSCISANNLKLEVISSGDEPWVQGFISGNSIDLYDANYQGPIQSTTEISASNSILNLNFVNGNKTIASVSASTTSSANITFNHEGISTYSSTATNLNVDLTINRSAASDSLLNANKALKFFAIDPTGDQDQGTGLRTDNYGHLVGVRGKEITLHHNYINAIDFTITDTSSTANNGIVTNRIALGITPYDFLNLSSSTTALNGRNTTGQLTFESESLTISGSTTAQSQSYTGSSYNNGILSIEMEWGTFQ